MCWKGEGVRSANVSYDNYCVYRIIVQGPMKKMFGHISIYGLLFMMESTVYPKARAWLLFLVRIKPTGFEIYTTEICDNEVRCCYISAHVLTCFRLTKGRGTEIFVGSLLLFIMLLFKVLFNHLTELQSQLQYMFLHKILKISLQLCENLNKKFKYTTVIFCKKYITQVCLEI